MSVYETSFLVIDTWLPKIRYDSSCITARTSYLLQFVCLFSTARKIIACSTTRTVTIFTRQWWFRGVTAIIPFTNISYIDISKITVGSYPGFTKEGVGWYDQKESIIPYLMTTDGKKVSLVSFYGEGSRATGWCGVLFGDSIVDFKGRQEKRAREFAERIASMIGIPFGADYILAKARSTVDKIKCGSCGHYNAKTNKTCLYCGAVVGNA